MRRTRGWGTTVPLDRRMKVYDASFVSPKFLGNRVDRMVATWFTEDMANRTATVVYRLHGGTTLTEATGLVARKGGYTYITHRRAIAQTIIYTSWEVA